MSASLSGGERGERGAEVEQVLGDTAYGSMALGEREVIAPMVKPQLPKEGEVQIGEADFLIDTEANMVRCPQGQATRNWRVVKVEGQETKRFTFAGAMCAAGPRTGECVNERRRGKGLGREVALYPHETRLQATRAFEQAEYFQEQYRQRVGVEHRIARAMALGCARQGMWGERRCSCKRR